MFRRIPFLATLLLCSCQTPLGTKPYAHGITAEGKIYLLIGTENEARVPAWSLSHGGTTNVNVAVRREFTLYERGSPNRELGRYVQTDAEELGDHDQIYFPSLHRVVVRGSTLEGHTLHTLGKAPLVNLNASVINEKQAEASHFLLLSEHVHASLYEVITGKQTKLSGKASAFVAGDIEAYDWMTRSYCVSDAGRTIVRAAFEKDRVLLISFWDLNLDRVVRECSIPHSEQFGGAKLAYFQPVPGGFDAFFAGKTGTAVSCRGDDLRVTSVPMARNLWSASISTDGPHRIRVLEERWKGDPKAIQWKTYCVNLVDGMTSDMEVFGLADQ